MVNFLITSDTVICNHGGSANLSLAIADAIADFTIGSGNPFTNIKLNVGPFAGCGALNPSGAPNPCLNINVLSFSLLCSHENQPMLVIPAGSVIGAPDNFATQHLPVGTPLPGIHSVTASTSSFVDTEV